MRNDWFPRRVAEYVTIPQLRDLRVKNVATERDFQFGLTEVKKEDVDKQQEMPTDVLAESTPELLHDKPRRPTPKPIDLELLSPERSSQLLSILLPSRLDFYRQPIEHISAAPTPTPPAPPEARRERDRSVSGAAADLLAARAVKPVPESLKAPANTTIYGSVSTADVLTAVRASLAENDEAARVVMSEEDVRFVGVTFEAEGAETDRVKHLGNFEVEISVKGSSEVVRRALRVLPQEG
ncbi:hypothetical protein LTR66_003505 [Elasticomyces elasticus]|nr:hypothetical protein LTR66_003505 [Elasticomyces elasticus]KAK5005528.1 hypothetical protein LTR28_007603 [Elasticomyces elasticus]